MSPRAVVTPENLSYDFTVDLDRPDGPVGLHLNSLHFFRHEVTGMISINPAMIGVDGLIDLIVPALLNDLTDVDSAPVDKSYLRFQIAGNKWVADPGITGAEIVTSINSALGSTIWQQGAGASVGVTQIFINNGLWTKPFGARRCRVTMFGPGGSGGGGFHRSAGATVGWSGGGGGAGMRFDVWLDADDLGATENVVIGQSGAIGIGNAAGASPGTNGDFGSFTQFGALFAHPGKPGKGGLNNSGTGNTGGKSGGGDGENFQGGEAFTGNGAISANAAGINGDMGGKRPGGGGSGAGFLNASNTDRPGSQGGKGGAMFRTYSPQLFGDTEFNGHGGAAGASSGGAGGNGADAIIKGLGGDGGGGGGNSGATGPGGNGGNGGFPGGGGGGGGVGTTDGISSGNGGAGGAGQVIVETFF